jgi:hypothetical protein
MKKPGIPKMGMGMGMGIPEPDILLTSSVESVSRESSDADQMQGNREYH